jgi:hypothetical protein
MMAIFCCFVYKMLNLYYKTSTMPSVNLKHETFIREMIAHGDRQKAYLTAYPASKEAAAYNNACRLLSRPEIRNRIMAAVERTEEEVTLEMKQAYKGLIADTIEKRIELARYIRGEKVVPKWIRGKKGKYLVYQHPTPGQILSAIVLDTKIEAGWYRKI